MRMLKQQNDMILQRCVCVCVSLFLFFFRSRWNGRTLACGQCIYWLLSSRVCATTAQTHTYLQAGAHGEGHAAPPAAPVPRRRLGHHAGVAGAAGEGRERGHAQGEGPAPPPPPPRPGRLDHLLRHGQGHHDGEAHLPPRPDEVRRSVGRSVGRGRSRAGSLFFVCLPSSYARRNLHTQSRAMDCLTD